MVVAADHVGDIHVDVVDHHAEVVGGGAVGARDHEVIQFVIADFNAALDLVFPRHHATLRVFETQHGLHTFGHRRQGLAIFGAPGAVVTGFLFGRHLLFAQRIEFGHAHVAGIYMARSLQIGQHGLVAVHALHLIEGAFVMVEP
ncbi:hypothetical protein D3C72_1910320 [compost metagenome]